MIRCQACGTQNLDGSQYCDECGDSLHKYKAPTAAEPAPAGEESGGGEEVPVFQSASVTSVGVPAVADDESGTSPEIEEEEEQTVVRAPGGNTAEQPVSTAPEPSERSGTAGHGGIHSKLIIERGQAIGTEFPLSTEESNIGRWDADNGVFPDVDLDAHDPEAKVSRKHARVILRNGQYLIEDLGSTNGTFINRGRRLIPGSPHILNDGDEIIVGKTFLRFQINDRTEN